MVTNIHTSQLAHHMVVDVTGATVDAGKVVVSASFPNGVQPIPSTLQVTNTHTTWNCSVTASAVVCRNTSSFVPGTGGARFSVSLTVSAPTTATVVSRIDPFGTVTESNEANNAGVYTHHFVQ